ncbi:hypothetical protein [Robertkochia solimangrovi]|uniref:hypothetical protein n=1 Tax=Robertkochia solimangrovi TaxID=2213046 RepID=UPI00117E69CB|nr:hypothetical protein [Robertkochia solimangrovi]TRZ42553.1 hypothetical protein DMZ48_13715 [Robertkochia solimangrovi]
MESTEQNYEVLCSGTIILPDNCPETIADSIQISCLNTGLLDAPATKVSELEMKQVQVGPKKIVPFDFIIQTSVPMKHLSLRVIIQLDSSSDQTQGNKLRTVEHFPLTNFIGLNTGKMSVKFY